MRERQLLERLLRSSTADHHLTITYLKALATDELDDVTYFDLVSSTEGTLREQVSPFRAVRYLLKEWSYPLSRALRSVAMAVRERNSKSLVDKMSKAVEAGMRVVNFVRLEYERFRDFGRREMEGALEQARTLSDLYVTLISTLTFLFAAFVVASSTFSGISAAEVVTLIALAAVASSIGVSFVAWRILKPDTIITSSQYAPLLVKTIESLSMLIALSLLGTSIASVMLLDPPIADLTIAAAAAVSLSIGSVGWFKTRKVPALDEELPLLFRSLAEIMSHIKNPAASVEVVMIGHRGRVRRTLEELKSLLSSGVELGVAMRSTFGRTCSKLATDSVELLLECNRLLGSTRAVGNEVFVYLNDKLVLRRKRLQLAGYVKGISLPSVGTSAAVFGVVGSLYSLLQDISAVVSTFLPLRLDMPIDLMWRVTIIMLIAFSATSSLLIHLASGTSRTRLLVDLATFLVVGSLVHFLTMTGTTALLKSLTIHYENLIPVG
ncbi:MAG: hypothetical protein NZ988_03980 [Thaumarchaeota archaeon]|nr:hypothetical protein [Candidatus Calditenuaceae archaeon]MDW8187189.1 hypothetical protein [Nitrososphaerota archaeon]